MITRTRSTYIVRNTVALGSLRHGLSGELLFPGQPSYDEARRIWNGMIDRYPAMIVRAKRAADVAGAIRFARRVELPLSVRGGGHGGAGAAVVDGGVMIDLSQMKDIRVDPIRLTARMQPGVTLGELVAATEAYGLATTTGTVSGTGMAGLTLGGGMGWLMGSYGLTIDNLLSVEIVTADGEIRHASAEENGDLFWAVRGGGGNFGVVTSFEYRLHPIGPMLAGVVAHPLEHAREVLRFYREFARAAPDELTVYAAIISTPDGHPAIALAACYNGPIEQGERLLAPLRAFGSPVADMIRPMSYYETITMLDAGVPDGLRYYERANAVEELTDAAIDAIVAAGVARTSPRSQVLIQHVHGAAARVAPTATAAAALRGEHFVVGFIGAWSEGADAEHMGWVRGASEQTRPFARAGVYVNFLNDDGADRVRATYGVNYERLAAIKRKYDAENVFRLNQNIAPARQG
jgi:FAD/FMN-containing dehydrogenase